MHPLALMGILATVAGLVAAAVALFQVQRYGSPLGPVLLGNGIPLLVLLAGLVLSIRQMRSGRRSTPILLFAFLAFLLTWWFLNV